MSNQKKSKITKIDKLWDKHFDACHELAFAALDYIATHEMDHGEECETSDNLARRAERWHETFHKADNAEIREAGKRQAAELGERGAA